MCHAHRLEPVNSRRWDLFNPLVPCPDGGALKRVGSSEDGGKWLCAETLEAPCVVYSIGSNGQYDWEIAVLDVSWINSVCCVGVLCKHSLSMVLHSGISCRTAGPLVADLAAGPPPAACGRASALQTTSCEVHTFDCTYNGASQRPGRHFYHNIW